MLKKLNDAKHYKQNKFHYVYNNSTQFLYEIMFNLNKNLFFNYSYHFKITANILSLCI